MLSWFPRVMSTPERGVAAFVGAFVVLFLASSMVFSMPPDGDAHFEIAAGDSVTAQIALGADDAPLEVALLLDATGSYSTDMRKTTADIATALDRVVARGTVVRVAIALAGDVPLFPFGTATDRVYRVETQLIANWRDVLSHVEAIEGGGDEREGMLGALLALAGGQSEPGLPQPSASASGAPIAFSPSSRRVVVVVTDSQPHESTDRWCGDQGCISYPGPTTEAVREAFAAQRLGLLSVTTAEPGALAVLAHDLDGIVVRPDAPDFLHQITNALEQSRSGARPTLNDCSDVTATFAPLGPTAKPSRATAWSMTLAVAPDAAAGPRRCVIALDENTTRSLTVDVISRCDATTPTSTGPPSTTTTEACRSTTSTTSTPTTSKGTASTTSTSSTPTTSKRTASTTSTMAPPATTSSTPTTSAPTTSTTTTPSSTTTRATTTVPSSTSVPTTTTTPSSTIPGSPTTTRPA